MNKPVNVPGNRPHCHVQYLNLEVLSGCILICNRPKIIIHENPDESSEIHNSTLYCQYFCNN
jgi:hypothetical protein